MSVTHRNVDNTPDSTLSVEFEDSLDLVWLGEIALVRGNLGGFYILFSGVV